MKQLQKWSKQLMEVENILEWLDSTDYTHEKLKLVRKINWSVLTEIHNATKIKPFQVVFEYDEGVRKWDVFVHGASTELEAQQGFNAVVLTTAEATPRVDFNRAEIMPDGSYKISVGKFPQQSVNQN